MRAADVKQHKMNSTNGRISLKSLAPESQFKAALQALTPGNHAVSVTLELDLDTWVSLQTIARKQRKTLDQVASEVIESSNSLLEIVR